MNFSRKLVLITMCLTAVQPHPIDLNVENSNSQFDDDIVTTSCPTPVYKMKDPVEQMSKKFGDMKTKFLNNQGVVFNEATDKINQFKASRDYDLGTNQDAIRYLKDSMKTNMEDLEQTRSEIEGDIAQIKYETNDADAESTDNMKMTEEEYRNKLEKLKERKYLLTALMTQHCDDCDDETLKKYKLDVELAKTDKDILDLEENFLKQAEEDEKKLKELDAGKARELNEKYSKLIDILKKELNEYKLTETINEKNDNIISEWKEYSENIENLHINIKSKIEDLTNTSLDFNTLTDSDKDSTTEDEDSTTEDDSINKYDVVTESNQISSVSSMDEEGSQATYKWITYNEGYSSLPSNVVLGGSDIDDVSLYVIRISSGDTYIYGKYARGDGTNLGYVTNEYKEYAVTNFELLTAKDYFWCSSYSFVPDNSELPICRASFNGSVIPGTLLKDMTCKIGFDYKAEIVVDNFEILSVNGCNNVENSVSNY